MNWDRFHHICRRSEAAEASGGALAALATSRELELFGPPLKPDSLPGRMLEQLAKISDLATRKSAMSLLGQLDFSVSETASSKYKQASQYLLLLGLVLCMVVGIYQQYVWPALLDIINNLQTPLPEGTQWLIAHNTTLLTAVMLVLIAVYLYILLLQRLGTLALDADNRLLWLLPKTITRQYRQLLGLINFPLGEQALFRSQNLEILTRTPELDPALELPVLLRQAQGRLHRAVDAFQQKLIALASVAIAGTLGLFLINLYTPIFKLGAIS